MGKLIRTNDAYATPIEALEPRRMLSASVVADILPGTTGSSPSEVQEVGGLTLFTAHHPSHGRELWTTDGTPGGTRMIKDLIPGPTSGAPRSFTAFNGAVYFFSNDDVLWRTDGTTGGTFIVQDDPAKRYFRAMDHLTAFNGALYFFDTPENGIARLYRSDGTATGLSRLLPFPWNAGAKGVGGLVPIGDAMVFSYGSDLCRTDGTPDGTYRIGPVSAGSQFHRLGDALVFLGDDGGRSAIWRTDGTAEGTRIVKDLRAGATRFGLGQGIVHGNTLFLSAEDETHGVELWKTDGTWAGTAMVVDLAPSLSKPWGMSAAGAAALDSVIVYWPVPDGVPSSHPSNFHSTGTHVIFTATVTGGTQLFRTDGSVAGTVQLANLGGYQSTSGQSGGSIYRDFQRVSDSVFFTTKMHDTDGGDLYVTDGTPDGTRWLWAAPDQPIFASSIFGLSVARGAMYFAAWTSEYGSELMRWDATGGIAGFAHDDANGNGVRDPSEMPLVGWRAFLDRNGNGAFNRGEPFTFTDADGAYGFPAFAAGRYTLALSPGEGWKVAAAPVTVQRGRTTWRDAGAVRADQRRGSVAGNVFNDADFDGTFKPSGDEQPYPGVRVYLDVNGNGYWSRGEPFTFSDEDGDYRIRDVLPGRYRVAIPELGEGHEYTRGIDETVVVLPGSTQDVDFGIGYDGGNAMIHGVAYDDDDGDGKRDADEPGLAGLHLLLSRPIGQTIYSWGAITDATGYYKITRLRRGQYQLRQSELGGDWSVTTGAERPVDLRPRERRTLDFGNRFAGTASVYGSIYNDRNENRVRDAGEGGLGGIEVYLDLNRNGVRDAGEASTRTASDGEYEFERQFSRSDVGRLGLVVPSQWRVVDPFATQYWEFYLTPRSRRDIVPIGLAHWTGVEGTVFLDRDRDGRRDPGEAPADGISVWLDQNSDGYFDVHESIRTTQDGGRFTFRLKPGTYHLWLGDDRVTKPSPVLIEIEQGVMDELEIALQPL